MKVMIVDDVLFIRQVMTASLMNFGIECIAVETGEEAIARFQEEDVDVILMDVLMPGLDGFETTRQIKALSGDRHVPVIFMTGMSEGDALQRCLECGGDDFVNKDIDPIALHARIKAHARTLELTRQIQQKGDEINRLYQELSKEYHMAQHVMASITAENDMEIPNVVAHLKSMSIFNGDLFLSTRKSSGGFCFFLGDFTGHGLPASIGAVPASQVFFESNRQQASLSEIATRINSVLTRCLPDYMFCAAVIGELDASGNTLKIWHGGLPDIIWLKEGEGVMKELESRHMPLGILDDEEFDHRINTFRLNDGEHVVFQTDGIIESLSPQGDMYGYDRLIKRLGNAARQRIPLTDYVPDLLQDWEPFCGENIEQDDMSLIILSPGAVDASQDTHALPAMLPWHTSLQLGPDELRSNLDPVRFLIEQTRLPARYAGHVSYLTTILKELYSNALEHGLLNLDSNMKHSEDGMMDYYQLREERLHALNTGEIHISIGIRHTQAPHIMHIRIHNSGKGFDYRALNKQSSALESEQLHGRGVSLVKGLCEQLTYSDEGRTVEARYVLS